MIQEQVLGALLINNRLFVEYHNELKKDFFTSTNKKIFEAIEWLVLNAYDANVDSVVRQCKCDEIDNTLLTDIVAYGIKSSDFSFDLFGLMNEYTEHLLRETSMGLSARIEMANDAEVIVDYLNVQISKLNSQQEKEQTIPEVLHTINKRIESNNGSTISGVDTGFNNLNAITNGWQNGELIIIAGRPAMGKTAFVTTTISNVSNKLKCVLFSLEMSTEQMVTRLLSVNNVPLQDIKSGKITDYTNYNNARTTVSQLNIKIFDKIYKLKSIILKVKELKLQGNCDVVIIDYLQLIIHSQTSRNRENEVSEISRQLKLLAKELNVPVICLSQLSRNVESRRDYMPRLSDLRESGSIEQDADIVGFLFRPEYYGIMEDENGNSTNGKAYLLIEKNRNGKLANLEYYFDGKYTKFEENTGIQRSAESTF